MARPRSVSDQEVFRAVRDAVLEQGPQVSLDVVAERIGVTAPALFRRFGNRQELLLLSLRPEERPAFLDLLDAGPDVSAKAAPIEEQIVEIFTEIGHYLVRTLPCMVALRESGLPFSAIHATSDEPPPIRTIKALAAWLERATNAGKLAVPDPTATAMAMIGSVHMPIFIRHITNGKKAHEPRHFARELAQIFLEGIAGSQRPASKRKERS